MLPKCRILSEYLGFITFSSDSRTNYAISRISIPAIVSPYHPPIDLTHAHSRTGILCRYGCISETESSDRLSESEADETEISGNASATNGETPGLPQKRKKYNFHVATGRSTISVFHGRLTQREGLLMHSVCPVVEISA